MSAATDYQLLRDRRIKQLTERSVRKSLLATTCRRLHGSVMPLSDYLRWSKDELVNEIIQTELPQTPAPDVSTPVEQADGHPDLSPPVAGPGEPETQPIDLLGALVASVDRAQSAGAR